MNWLASGSWKPWLRRLLAVLSGAAAMYCMRVEFAGILVALPLGMLMALLAFPDLVWPLTRLVDVLMGTGTPSGRRPPLDLRLARYYLKEERWEDAFEEYERIRSYYPGVEEPYEELLKLGARLGHSGQRMERLYRKAVRRIRDREARSRLFRAWEEAREMMRSGPEKEV